MTHSKVYQRVAFAYRVNFAASVIARGGNTTRNFDTCCEMNDGDAVVAALMRRAKANPGGPLAKNFSRYLNVELAEKYYQETVHMSSRELVEYAAKLRHDAQVERDAWFEKMRKEREAAA